MKMLDALKIFIRENALFKYNDRLLLGISGGVDSVVMLDMLMQLKVEVSVAHCNFQLRKSDSDKDEAFVKKLADDYGLKFFCKAFDTKKFATSTGMSIQQAARELRYEWFEELRSDLGFDYIAVAHHSNDRIETYLLNMIRGTGIAGYHSLEVKNGLVVRPLLSFSKVQILKYAATKKLKFREDKSNSDHKYKRNKIRNEVLPLLKTINPAIEETMLENIRILGETDKIYRERLENVRKSIVKKQGNTWTISIAKLLELDPLRTYLFELLDEFGFSSSMVDEVIHSLNRQSGKKFLSATHILVKDRQFLIISELTSGSNGKPEIISSKQQSITVPIGLRMKQYNIEHFNLPDSKKVASLDSGKLKYPLKVRKWKNGDFFYPLGMNQKKKLSDFFIDNKISVTEKENIFVVQSGNDIAWIIGHRIDDRYKITENTKQVYQMELKSGRNK